MNDLPEPQSMELPQPNLPLLRKVLDHIDHHPDEWAQDGWFTTAAELVDLERSVPVCGTAYCIAGHAVAMTEGVARQGDKQRPASGRSWLSAGMSALGLTSSEALRLFDGLNTRDHVHAAAEAIAARAGERL